MLVAALAYQSSAIDFQWYRTYNGGLNDATIHTAAVGSYVFTVSTVTQAGGTKILTTSYNTAGVLGAQYLGSTYLSSANVKQVLRDDALGIYILCENSPTSYTIIKYRPNGVEAWRRNYANYLVGMQLGNTGGLYLSYTTTSAIIVRKLNRTNASTVWTRTYADANVYSNSSSDIAVDANDFVYVGATTGTSSGDYHLIKIRKNGNLIYNSIIDDGDDEELDKIAVNSAGELFVVGDWDNDIPTRTSWHVVKFSTTGGLLWATQIAYSSTTGTYFPTDIMTGPDGNPITVGDSRDFYNINPSGETARVKVAKLSSTGAIIFNNTPIDPSQTSLTIDEVSDCMAIDASGDIYYGGNTNITSAGGSRVSWLVTKVNGITGNLAWTDAGGFINSPENKIKSIAVNSNFDVFAGGVNLIGANNDAVLYKYCQVGCFARMAAPQLALSSLNANVYPNPSVNSFRLTSNASAENAVTATLFSVTGQTLETFIITENEFSFGEKLSVGNYILKLQSAEGVQNIQLIKAQ